MDHVLVEQIEVRHSQRDCQRGAARHRDRPFGSDACTGPQARVACHIVEHLRIVLGEVCPHIEDKRLSSGDAERAGHREMYLVGDRRGNLAVGEIPRGRATGGTRDAT